jgi:predicted DNA-binding transcriptional regulator AlpA
VKPEANPYGLPAVLTITVLARVLESSVRSIYRGLEDGTFPLRPMTSPAQPLGLGKRFRWARRDVEQFLDGGFRAFDRAALRIRRSA